MEIIVSGRHNMELTDELHQYVEGKFSALREEYEKLTNLRLVLGMERNWHVAEAHLTGKHIDFEAKAQTKDMYVSIDEVYDKLHKQLRKYIEKVRNHRGSQQLAESIKDEMPELKPESGEEAEEETEEEGI